MAPEASHGSENPQGITLDSDGTTVHVTDTGNSTIRKITPDRIVTTTLGWTAGKHRQH